jgi:hypothetical protein
MEITKEIKVTVVLSQSDIIEISNRLAQIANILSNQTNLDASLSDKDIIYMAQQEVMILDKFLLPITFTI